MSYKVDTTENFDREAKKLAKKYKSIKSEIADLIAELERNPIQGTQLGNSVYKIRMSIASKGKGKRGGARVMTYVKISGQTVYLFSIYSKGEKNDISDTKIQELTRDIL